jgi:hypothetical protein
MRRRYLVLGAVLIATPLPGATFSLAASAGSSLDQPAPADQRFMLSCAGAMATDGRARPDESDPAERIVASAIVDFSAGNVNGFGIGAIPIVVVTPALIGFGSAPAATLLPAAEPRAPVEGAKSGLVVEGSFHRLSGATTVLVHPAADLEQVLIAMSLDCRIEPAPH